MSKKYTAAELNQLLRDILCGALEHMEAIKKEIRKLDIRDESTCNPQDLARAKVLTLTLTCINDIIHPAHKLCYKMFKGNDEYFDMFVRNHKIAVETKMVPPCFCDSCKRTLKKENTVNDDQGGNKDKAQ